VKIVDIDCLNAEVGEAPIKLILNVFWVDAVTLRSQICHADSRVAWLEVLLIKPVYMVWSWMRNNAAFPTDN